jgi:transcriptional regulator with XRE-family HTH domain
MLNALTSTMHSSELPTVYEWSSPQRDSTQNKQVAKQELSALTDAPANDTFEFLRITVFNTLSAVGQAPSSLSTSEKLRYAMTQLNATGAQLASALDITRARVYQLLDGQNASSVTANRLTRLEWAAQRWSAMQSRPLGMILPKPKADIETLWALLADQNASTDDIEKCLQRISHLHNAFEERETARKRVSVGIEGIRLPVRPSDLASK